MAELSQLRAIREDQALSIRALSARSGVSPATILRAEQGKTPYLTTVRKLAKALGVTPAELRGADAMAVPGPSVPMVLVGDERRARVLSELREDARRALERGDLVAAARYEAAIAGYGESPLR